MKLIIGKAYEVVGQLETFRGIFIGLKGDHRFEFKVNDSIYNRDERFIDSITEADADEVKAKHDAYCSDKAKTLASWGTTE